MSKTPRRFPATVAALGAGAVLFAGLGAASSDAASGSAITGSSTNRYGTTSIRIGGGFATIKVSRRIGATSGKRSFVLSCRTTTGDYEDVVGIVPFSDTRTMRAPAPTPRGKIVRCRVKREDKLLLATMKVKRG